MKENQFNWITNIYIPTMYQGAFFDLIRGRDVTRNILGLAPGNSAIRAFSFVTKYLKDKNNLKYLKTYFKYLYEMNKDYYLKNLSIIY